MTDMPHFRAWADRAFKETMQPHRSKKRKTRYRCVSSICKHGNSLAQALANKGDCKCGSPLISKTKIMNSPETAVGRQ